MTHCTMDQLLGLRDGEGSPWARQHVATCRDCAAELGALHQRVAGLRALPARHPSRDRWPEVRDTLAAARRERRRRIAWSLTGLAAAAGLAAVLVVSGLGMNATPVYADEIARAKLESAALEADLADHSGPGRVVSGREAALCAELEDRIAVVDGALARVARETELLDLWQQRVELMQHLYAVRATRAAYVGF